ncbi:hypothetical protein [Nocardia sp. XZ_19_385]|uniref:hypothetical protein n=1 Tax=Nocardia sp. XZ_19_385 TaxID=2769488 RepID=UPI00188FB415|nr:hypothetical protein [Nocardia sp. XZ_19_385]
MADTITIRTDAETEHALEVLTADGQTRSAAIRAAVLGEARRRERLADMQWEVLNIPLGELDGINLGDEIARERSGEL